MDIVPKGNTGSILFVLLLGGILLLVLLVHAEQLCSHVILGSFDKRLHRLAVELDRNTAQSGCKIENASVHPACVHLIQSLHTNARLRVATWG